jgi:biotin synthase
MLTETQARRLAAAGLTAYNHNLDTGPEHYGRIITTRTYDDRLRTLDALDRAGVSVCCGGILGLGESVADRVAMLGVLARRDPHPGPANADNRAAIERFGEVPVVAELPRVEPLTLAALQGDSAFRIDDLLLRELFASPDA